ncbi:PH domain-containing protein [Halobacillus mangrovi]|uniref:YdbS-like PH domain-containing protein n=1 Tax=Halobacillus mangrovi TaxID=402384 RepID=A0A1W5ZY57_9BACI|nr:PH domain-containing protein [Halobacillus mangrovi]ARI78199.1 hypothetical protein HM131_15675 [Halobacillus mangrovi]
MFEPKRLHPISALINFVKSLKDALLPLLVVFFINGNVLSGDIEWVPLLIWVGFLLLILVAGIVKWLRFTYRVEEGELRIEYGLLFRKKRYIPFERIQSLDFSEGIFHRPFQLVKVSVETAGSTDSQKAEGELTAIKLTEAKELEALILKEKNKKVEYEQGEESKNEWSARKKVYEMNMKDIILMAITSGGAGVVISGVGVFFSQVMDVLPLGAIYDQILDWIQIGVLIVAFTALMVLLIAYAISILLTIFRYANFTVYLNEDDLIITRGWLEKKQMTIPLNRIQGLRVDENLIRQPLGFASVTIISAGGGLPNESDQQLRVLPFIKKKKIARVLQEILTEYRFDVDWKKPPKRAKIRYMIRHSWFAWLAVVPLSIFLFPYGVFGILGALAFTGLGLLAYNDAGWDIEDQQLTLRSRSITRQTYVMKKYRIQAASLSQSIFQKRVDLESVHVTLKSGVGGAQAQCLYLEDKDSRKIIGWYRPG